MDRLVWKVEVGAGIAAMTRRLSEAGVRFVEICQGGWDHHNNLHKGLINNAAATDQPTAQEL